MSRALTALILAASLPASATTLRHTPGWADAQALATVLSGSDNTDTPIDAWAVTPAGQWLVVAGGTVRHSGGFPVDVVNAAKLNLMFGRTIEAADCNASGVCVLVHSSGVYANGPIPALLTTRVTEWHNAGRAVLDVELTTNGYALIGEAGLLSHVGMSAELGRALADPRSSGRQLRDLAIGFDGRWWLQVDSQAQYAGLDATTQLWADAGMSSAVDWDRLLLGPGNTFIVTKAADTSYAFDTSDPTEAVEATLGDGDDLIWNRMAEAGIHGVSIAILDGGEVVSARGYGTRTEGLQQPVYGSTPFDIASLSKMIGGMTSLAVLANAQQVTLTTDLRSVLSPTLSTWLGRGAAADPAQGFDLIGARPTMPAITLEQVLSHTASLTLGGSTPVPASQAAGAASVSTADWLSGWACEDDGCTWDGSQTVWFNPNVGPNGQGGSPGGQFAYTSDGYLVAQALVEDLANSPAATVIQNRIIDPMGLKDTTASWPFSSSFAARMATQHDGNGPVERTYYPWTFAGGVTSSARDYAAIVSVILNDGVAPNGAAILSQASARNVRTGRNIAGNSWAYGLGVAFDTAQGATVQNGDTFFHSGGHPGRTNTYFCARPADGGGIVILMNTDDDGGQADALRDEILSAFIAAKGWVDEDCR